MISILHFSNTLTRGGVEEHMLSLLRGLDRGLFRPYLACTPAVLNEIGSDIPRDVEVFPTELVSFRSFGAAFKLGRVLCNKNIQILHCHMFQSSLLAAPVAQLCRVPVVIETPHVREHWRRGWLKGRFVVDRLVGTAVDHYIAVSRANAEYLERSKRLSKRKITHIRQGCDLQRFRAACDVPAEFKQSLGFDDRDPVLAIIGRLEPQKGHAILFEALRRIRTEFPKVRVVCVGEGSLRTELAERVEQLGLRDHVKFVGFQADVPRWLALADISVLPSFYEGLPIAAIESIAAGCPVVATAVDGTPEVVVDGKTGLTVPPGKPELLAQAICRLLRDPDWRIEMAREGRRWAERFSRERFVRETQDFYLRAWQQYHSASRFPDAGSCLTSSR